MRKRNQIEITPNGIKRILNKYTPERSISEYIWNGFDADANTVRIKFSENDLGMIETIEILDDGFGINYTQLEEKFKRFHESLKGFTSSDGHKLKGKNGYGRLTFFKIASDIQWDTCFRMNNENHEYSISISASDLKTYETTTPKKTKKKTGTIVTIKNVLINKTIAQISESLKKYLTADFSWFLALNPEKTIVIEGEKLDIDDYIGDHEIWSMQIDDITFNADFFRWNGKLNEEFSKIYYLNSQSNLVFEETTKLNKKGDGFWHTVIVSNAFFNDVNLEMNDINSLFSDEKLINTMKKLESELNNRLKEKRKPFLHQKAIEFVSKCQESNTFPAFGDNSWDEERKKSLEQFIVEFYELDPQIFIKLTKNQQRILLSLLNLVMDSSSRSDLFTILDEIVSLDDEERSRLSALLENTKLTHIIELSNLVKDRLVTIKNLKELVFNHELNANERDNLQKFIELHYWIFGEEYRMVCSESVKFEEALRRYRFILLGVDEHEYIKDPNRLKEMDLFLTGTEYRNDYPHNIVVEIKNPTTIKRLTDKELSQIKTYMNVIKNNDQFNNLSAEWTYFLIGQDYDENVKVSIIDKHSGLIVSSDNHKIYVKKWSEIIQDAEARMHYLEEKLKLQRRSFSEKKDLPEIMDEISANSAVVLPFCNKSNRKKAMADEWIS